MSNVKPDTTPANADYDGDELNFSIVGDRPPTLDRRPPTCEKEATKRGRGGEFAPSGTPINLALIQNSAANVYHAYKAQHG